MRCTYPAYGYATIAGVNVGRISGSASGTGRAEVQQMSGEGICSGRHNENLISAKPSLFQQAGIQTFCRMRCTYPAYGFAAQL